MAAVVLTQGLQNAGRDAEFYAFLAPLYQRQNRHNQAVKLYRHALSITPRVGKWWLGLAISLETIGDKSRALKAYRRALLDNALPLAAIDYGQQRISALVTQSGVTN